MNKPKKLPIIQLQNLQVTFYPKTRPLYAVRGIDLSVQQGETLGIVGESGSGKSVTAFTLLQLPDPNSETIGKVLFHGQSLSDLTPKQLLQYRRKKVGIISQEPSLSFDPIHSIYSCFAEKFKLINPRITKDEIIKKASDLLEAVEISNPAHRLKNFPHQFSGGMLQRILIALALANDPEILIADEPTTALDVTIQARIINLLKKIQTERKLTLIFISHDINLVSDISDTIAVMYGGMLLEKGPAKKVLSKSYSPYTEELMRSMPRPGSHYTQGKLHTIEGSVPDPTQPTVGCPFAPRCSLAQKSCHLELPAIQTASTNLSQTGSHGEHEYRCILRRDQ